MSTLLKPLILFLVLGLTACGDNYPHVKTIDLNREGNKQLVAQNAQAALEKYLQALKFNPFQAELHLNLGLSFEFLQQPDKARSSYQEAERLAVLHEDLKTQFMALFNLAQLLGKEKKVDEAIAMYQKVLDILPSSKEAKTNIELLTQQQQGSGEGDGEKDPKDNQDQKTGKNKKDKEQDDKDKKDKDKKDDKDGDKKEDKPKKMQGSAKYKPRPFDGKELSEGDVKKILGELKQQEEKIRAEFNRKDVKEQPRDKDW